MAARETGLPEDTLFLCFQLRSLDHSRFLDPKARQPNHAGSMPPSRMREVDEALRLALGLALSDGIL